MKEIWKDVKDYEGLYQVSNYGRVKRLSKQKRNYNINTKNYDTIILPDKIVTPQLSQYGYYRIGLTKNGKRKCYLVHKLVAQAFISNPENKSQINHKDENKQNNYVENLEWCTAKYNSNYGTRNKRTGQKQMKPILCVETGIIYKSLSEAGKSTGLSIGNISCVCHHRKWCKTAGGYHWKYIEGIKPERKTRRKRCNMRNPKRITKILDELGKYWDNHPNWRLGQLMSNLSYELLGDNDPFFIEDERLLELLKLKNEKNL